MPEVNIYHQDVRVLSSNTATFLFAVIVCTASVALDGCRSSAGKGSVAAVKQYPIRGKVVRVEGNSIVLDHETIPGLMDAMTMSYRVADPAVLTEVHPGDRISATLTAGTDAAGPVNMRLEHVVVTAQGRPDTLPKVLYHVPQPGEAVPDVPLRNQSGKVIHLNQFRGKVVLLTFIYTRCAMPEFCLRMSRNFAEIDKALARDPAIYARTHLLSISFDPGFDTPAVLRSYGGAYTGRYSHENFAHWDFAVPSQPDLLKLEQFFDLGVTQGEGTTLNHSLATAIIGKDGKVLAFYPTNEWTADSVLAEIRKAAA